MQLTDRLLPVSPSLQELITMAKDAPAAKEAPRRADVQPTGDSGTNNQGIDGARDEAWGGFKNFWRKTTEVGGNVVDKAKDVGGAAVDKGGDLLKKGKDYVQSDEGKRMIQKGREGAADVVDAAGGHGQNRTVNEVVRNAKIIPGARTVLGAAETLSESGVTDVMRDGKGKVNQRRLVEGAIQNAPVTGELGTAVEIGRRTGITGRLTEAIRDRIKPEAERKPEAEPKPKKDTATPTTTQDKDRTHEEQQRARVKR